MDPYLQQFKNLPRELREAVSSDEKLKTLEEIEKKYGLKLVKVIVRIMIEDIAWTDLENFLVKEFNLTPEKASNLKKDLAEKIFNEVLEYLGEDSRLKIKGLSFEQKPAAAETQKHMEIDRNISRPDVGAKPSFVPPSGTTAGEVDFKKLVQEAKNIISSVASFVSSAAAEPEKIIKEIKQKLNLVFEDEVLEHRFDNIFRSYLRDVRNEVQTEEALQRAKKIGGLEFSPEKAALIIRVIKEYKKKYIETRRNMQPEAAKQLETIPPKAEEIDRNKQPTAAKYAPLGSEINRNIPPAAAKQGETKKPETFKTDEEMKKRFESGTILPAFKKIEPPFVPLGTTEGKKPIETKKQIETDRNMSRLGGTKQVEIKKGISIQIKHPISEEKLVGDINQGVPRAIGPVEELAEITPLDLQRWGGGENTTQIILDKINLLNEISLAKRAEGIHAWQKSPLYKLYLAIGQQALEQKKSVQQIIREKENNNQPFLKIEDFEAIVELNRKLRF